MMISVGHLAKTFGLLPSQVVANANTYDLMIADVMSSWEEYQMNKNKGAAPNLTEDQMLDIVNKVKNS